MRDLLYRFRPAGAPGAAGAAAVPSDRTAIAVAELTTVFEQLAAVELECAAVIARAERDAAAIRAAGAQRAHDVLAAARAGADAHTAQAAAELRQRGARAATATTAAAERDAAQTGRRAAEQLPEFVDQVVASVRRLLDADPPAAPGAARAT